tara:strand:- start:1562 stop:2128 length:567 start_codon:yes stop_codon:yes gene_type:complete
MNIEENNKANEAVGRQMWDRWVSDVQEDPVIKLGKVNKLRIFVDMDGVISDFKSEMDDYMLVNNLTKLHRPEMKIDFTKFKVMPGAKIAIQALEDLGHEVYIASTPPWDRPEVWGQKRDWICKYFPSLKRKMFLTHRKDFLDGDILIDDTQYRGQPLFKGEWIHFGTDKRFLDWNMVLTYITGSYEKV